MRYVVEPQTQRETLSDMEMTLSIIADSLVGINKSLATIAETLRETTCVNQYGARVFKVTRGLEP